MTKKQLIPLIFVFAAVFSFTFGFNMNVTAGPGPGGPPAWCNAIFEIEGHCCIDDDDNPGILEDVGPPGTAEFVCQCAGFYRGPLIYNPCECNFSCGAPG